MAEIDVMKAQIVRHDAAVGWGLTLAVTMQGGLGPHLTIQRILPGSPASRIGLRPGDMVTEIGDQPTAGMTAEHAMQTCNLHPQSLVLTIERKARGAIPDNPVVQSASPQLKQYQTYDMTGGGQPRTRTRANPPPHHMQQQQQPYVDYGNMNTAVSRPFEEPARGSPRGYQPVGAPPMPTAAAPSPPQPYAAAPMPPLRPPPRQIRNDPPPIMTVPQTKDADELRMGGTRHSRSFKILSSLMDSEEPYSGVQGLPPPRSAAMERMKQEQSPMSPTGSTASGSSGGPGQQRVKVFMPQQYNNPMSLYSAPNVVETFAAQAEGLLDEIETRAVETASQGSSMSGAQRAIMESEQQQQK